MEMKRVWIIETVNNEPDREIWGYIVGYNSAARRLEVAPKLDAEGAFTARGKFTITTPWIDLRAKR